jgi:hypothetical protein
MFYKLLGVLLVVGITVGVHTVEAEVRNEREWESERVVREWESGRVKVNANANRIKMFATASAVCCWE